MAERRLVINKNKSLNVCIRFTDSSLSVCPSSQIISSPSVSSLEAEKRKFNYNLKQQILPISRHIHCSALGWTVKVGSCGISVICRFSYVSSNNQ